MRFWLVVVCLLVVSCRTPSHGPVAEYLPRTAWSEEADWELMERWIGGQLRAMGEPSLLARGDVGQANVRTFRLFVAPSFQPAYAIRVTQHADGSGELVYVLLDGAGGYGPGKVQRRVTRRVSGTDITALRDAFETLQFQTLPIEPRNPPPPGEEVPICVDGTLFVFEVVDDGPYHVVMPDTCPGMLTGFANLASAFERLAGLSAN